MPERKRIVLLHNKEQVKAVTPGEGQVSMKGKKIKRNPRRNFVIVCLMLCLLMTGSPLPAAAVDESQSYAFNLTVNGAEEIAVKPGETVDLVLRLSRTDDSGPMTVYAVSSVLRFNSNLLELEELQTGSGVSCTETELSGSLEGWRDLTLNYLSPSMNGTVWENGCVLVTVRLKAVRYGFSMIQVRRGSVSTYSGMESYQTTLDSAVVSVSSAQEETRQPSFRNQSLLLSGQIGVNFYMDLPDLEGVDYSQSYMTFEIGHGPVTERDGYDPGFMNATGEYHGFTCYVNSIQMAEPVTAVFHYEQGGEEKSVEKSYSVSDYFNAFDNAVSNGSITDETTICLVHSLADYGHYVQPFLADARNWTLGEDYAVMEKHYADSYDMETIKGDVSSRAIRIDNQTGGDIETVTHSLLLDSNTEINVYFKPGESCGRNVSVSVDGGPAAEYTRASDGRYCVKISGISAHQLSKDHTVTVTTAEGRTATVTVSALSYVNSALNYYTDNTDPQHMDARNAVAAIYAYSKAADAYKEAHKNS